MEDQTIGFNATRRTLHVLDVDDTNFISYFHIKVCMILGRAWILDWTG